MPNSRRRMFHTCTGMGLFTVCNTLRGIGSPTVQDRLRRPHNNIRPHFSLPSPYTCTPPSARWDCSIRSRRLPGGWRRRNMCAASDQANPRRLPRRLSPEAAQPDRTGTAKFASRSPRQATVSHFLKWCVQWRKELNREKLQNRGEVSENVFHWQMDALKIKWYPPQSRDNIYAVRKATHMSAWIQI